MRRITNSAPLTEAVIKALTDRYGAPDAEPNKGHEFIWVFDAHGGKLANRKVTRTTILNCTPVSMSGSHMPDNLSGRDGTHEKFCRDSIVIRAMVSGEKGTPVRNYWVGMQNLAMLVAADAKSSAVVAQAGAAKQQQQHQKAAGNKTRL